MEDFNIKELQPYIFILIGLGSTLLAIFKKSTTGNLKSTGQKTEGIVYALGQNLDTNTSYTQNFNIKNKVTVRFLTMDKQWITGDLKQEFAAFFTKQYKEGERVEVYYDPEKPTNFFVDTKQSEKAARIIVATVGIVLVSAGLYQLLSH
ncbi:MAG TPA: DUF3592 domain-containing protein [Chitinophagaceae bacterium]